MDNFENQKTLTAEQRMSVIKNTFIAKTEALLSTARKIQRQ
jgi:hypothetical protein